MISKSLLFFSKGSCVSQIRDTCGIQPHGIVSSLDKYTVYVHPLKKILKCCYDYGMLYEDLFWNK